MLNFVGLYWVVAFGFFGAAFIISIHRLVSSYSLYQKQRDRYAWICYAGGILFMSLAVLTNSGV